MASSMDSLHVTLERLALAAERQAHATERLAQALEQLISLPGLTAVATSVGRLADHLAPCPSPIVGTPYVAERLGCTTVWVAELVRKGEIPKACLVPGTGRGKLWKFYREKIDRWLESR
jgi:predicted DNA-binding transcriptional regulator AlpA